MNLELSDLNTDQQLSGILNNLSLKKDFFSFFSLEGLSYTQFKVYSEYL